MYRGGAPLTYQRVITTSHEGGGGGGLNSEEITLI